MQICGTKGATLMKQFATIEKLDTGILYILELASSLSVLLIVLLIVAHAMRHVQRTSVQIAPAPQTIVIPQAEAERTPEALPPPKMPKCEQSPDNFARVKAYMGDHPNATAREVAKALQISATTANKWMCRAKEI
jgi:hypothetical protein